MTIKELLSGLETETNPKIKVFAVDVGSSEIAQYPAWNIDNEEYYGWEDKKVKFWSVTDGNLILYLEPTEQKAEG